MVTRRLPSVPLKRIYRAATHYYRAAHVTAG